MKNRVKKLAAIAAVISVTGALIAGCGSKDNTTKTGKNNSKKETITIATSDISKCSNNKFPKNAFLSQKIVHILCNILLITPCYNSLNRTFFHT